MPFALMSHGRFIVVALLLLASAATPLARQPARSESTDSIGPTASMRLARYAHTATALPDGRVLVVGGFTDEQQAAHGAEAFDPVAGRWAPVPRMVTLRHSHTTTSLPDGKVLIVGGYGAGSTTVPDAELFDPATNRFTATGSLRSARAGHIAVLLRSGKVLIAGGVGPGWSFLSSAELYDPATGRFSPTSDMTVPRESHAAVRLQDGRVLIVGGHQGRRAAITLYASAEVYDPVANVFRRVGDMGIRRHKHDAVLLQDGRVLVTGGSDERDSEGVYGSTELFDPARGTFTPGSPLVRPRYKHNGSAVLLPTGDVLIAGGAAQAETFNPTTGRFTLVMGSDQLAGQFSAVAVTGSGGALITGGYGNGKAAQSAAWLYRP